MVEPGDVRAGLLDERGAAAHRAERVDDAVVLSEVPGMLAVDGHAADRVEQHDVVDDRARGPSPRARPRSPRRPASPVRAWPRTAPGRAGPARSSAMIETRDLLGRLGAEVDAGGCPERGEPLLGDVRLVAQPRADHAGTGGRGDQADVRDVAPERGGQRLLVPDPLRRDDDVRGRARGRSARGRSPSSTRSASGNASASAIGSNTVTRQPVAAARVVSAPTIGVVPATQSDGAGRCGST